LTYTAQTVVLDAGDQSLRFHLTPLSFQYPIAPHDLKLMSCHRWGSYLQAYMLEVALSTKGKQHDSTQSNELHTILRGNLCSLTPLVRVVTAA